MEKDIGRIKKNDTTEVVVRVDDYGGKTGITIREFVKSDGYTGFTKSGTRIPAESFLEFRELINKISLNDLNAGSPEKTPSEEAEESEEAEDY